MRNQKGFTLIESLIVIAIIAVIAAIAIPSLMRAAVNVRSKPFKYAFGIELPLTYESRNEPLSDEVKRILRPYVQSRLTELCSPASPKWEESTDPVVIQRRLESTVQRAEKCVAAREVATKEGILPAEAP